MVYQMGRRLSGGHEKGAVTMDNYDPAMAGRVWERVRHRQEDDLSPTLMKLFAEAAADAALCIVDTGTAEAANRFNGIRP